MHRMRREALIAGFLVWVALGSSYSEAQYTANSQTNIISGVTSNWSGSYYVGNTFSTNVLFVQSNGVLTDAGGYLGYSSSSSNNSALVTDSGSIWSNGFLYVGFNGVGNSLVISNGAHVINTGEGWVSQGYIPKITSNSVVVTGSSSVWSNGLSLSVGDPGAGDRVVVSHGGRLINYNAYVGTYASSSSNNSVVVSDSASVWTNLGDVHIGDRGGANSLTVSNGGKVFGGFGFVGDGGGTNSTVVTGTGSLWSNRNDFCIGNSGARNSLAILDSGAVYSSFGIIGNGATAASNSVVVAGTGSVWRTVNSLYVGSLGVGNSLVISNGGHVITDFADSYMGYAVGSSNNSALVSDPGSVWSNSHALYIGDGGGGNSLIISNGGHVLSNDGTVGATLSGPGNRVWVTGLGSIWSNSAGLAFGYTGPGNRLVISNGGQVIDSIATLGYAYSSGSNNTALVTGTGSVWRSDGLRISAGGSSNAVVIDNGGKIVSTYGTISTGGGHKNTVLVTGPGSVWSNSLDLVISQFGTDNSLVISNGGEVVNADAYIGSTSINTSNNSARVCSGGVWRNHSLSVGYASSSNSLFVAGGTVFATNLIIGVASGPCNNLVQLDSGSLFVTNATGDAVLEVRYGSLVLNGGTLQVDTLVITNACGVYVPNGGTLIYNQLELDPDLSALGDGIPNGWKQQYGFDPLDPTVANADPDGDGFSNLQEYLAGTDPTNNASSFRIISVLPSGIDLSVTWMMGSGRTNALQATAGDASGGYDTNNFSDIFVVTNTVGTTTNYLDNGAATNVPARYYRVRVVP